MWSNVILWSPSEKISVFLFSFPREAKFHQHIKPFRAGGTFLLLGGLPWLSLAPSDTGKILPILQAQLKSTFLNQSCTISPGAIPLLHIHYALISWFTANHGIACLKFLLSRQGYFFSAQGTLRTQQTFANLDWEMTFS